MPATFEHEAAEAWHRRLIELHYGSALDDELAVCVVESEPETLWDSDDPPPRQGAAARLDDGLAVLFVDGVRAGRLLLQLERKDYTVPGWPESWDLIYVPEAHA